ncbi:MAG: hypothetical protein NC124_07700 [Clostridium sp.]|nr:hypothetical protein [Clostridium sp.]
MNLAQVGISQPLKTLLPRNAENYSHVHIDSSLAAKEMYLKRGYREKKTCRIPADNSDIFIYDEMEKQMLPIRK